MNGLKSFVRQEILSRLSHLDFVLSVTLVGSFLGKGFPKDDIDIVIIIDKFTETKSVEISYALKRLTYHRFLKNIELVFHPHIFDTVSYRKFCRTNPFVCFDWQISNVYAKKSLSEIHSISYLRAKDFLEYQKRIRIDPKQDEETKIRKSYRIIRNLIGNFLNFYHRKNLILDEVLIEEYFRINPLHAMEHRNTIDLVSTQLDIGSSSNGLCELIMHKTGNFVADFYKFFHINYSNKRKIKILDQKGKIDENIGLIWTSVESAEIAKKISKFLKVDMIVHHELSSKSNLDETDKSAKKALFDIINYNQENVLIVVQEQIIQTILGNMLSIPKHNWSKIQIEPIELILSNKKLYFA